MTQQTNTCPMCKWYTQPGFIINAWQIVPCFECNPDNVQGLPYPKSLGETAEGQARLVRPVDRTCPYKVLMTCGHVETRKMRCATAGVPWTPDVVLTAKAPCAQCDPTKGGR